jgi:nucleotide-binding universal stress UspA family protein
MPANIGSVRPNGTAPSARRPPHHHPDEMTQAQLILVGVDGSEPSLTAARMAARLAEATHSRLVLVYVVPPLVAASELLTYPAGLFQKLEDEGRAQLSHVAEALGQANAERVVIQGLPAEMLVRIAEERHAEMIVVGSRGRGAVARMLLGSVADRVVHTAGRPVLVVR